MNIGDYSNLAAALNAWGRHELEGRFRRPHPVGPEHDHVAIASCLKFRPQLVAAILMAEIHAVRLVELEPSDLPRLIRFDGGLVSKYTEWARASNGEPWQWIQQLIDKEIDSRLICCARTPIDDGPIVVFDGNHRASAWASQMQQGRTNLVGAYLIETEMAVATWPRTW